MKALVNYRKMVNVVTKMESDIDVIRKQWYVSSHKLKPFYLRMTHIQMLIEIFDHDRRGMDITLTDVNLLVFSDPRNYGNTHKRLITFQEIGLIEFDDRDVQHKNSVNVHLTKIGTTFVKSVLKCM